MREGRPRDPSGSDRRTFLKTAGTATALGIAGGALFPEGAMGMTKEKRDGMTPDQVIDLMKAGNERFRKGARKNRDYLKEQMATAKGQSPAAVLLSCIDSRAPAEVIMDLGIGDVFNCRVAGNIANEDILGSMEFACKLAGAKVILVMGHTSCGAIKGAIADAQLGNLTGLLGKIKPSVQATTYSGERSANDEAFVDAVAKKNVELTLAKIRKDSPVLAELADAGTIKMAGAMYNLGTGTVEFT